MFDTVLGLPVHPLAVHLPVALLPLAAVTLIVMVFNGAWRERLAVPVLVVLGVAAFGTAFAAISGDALAARVGEPGTHRQLGVALTVVAFAYLTGAGAWLLRSRRGGTQTSAQRLVGYGVAVASLVVIGLTAVTGHAGAASVWSGAATGVAVTPTAAPSGTRPGYSMDQVATHATAESCWTVVDGQVYDVTSWVDVHPGGRDRILALCGRDATADFQRQHGGEQLPAEKLVGLLVGSLTS